MRSGGRRSGIRAEGGELVEDTDEMVVVERIRELRAEGKSLRQIAETLTGEGLSPKRSERWHPYTVKRVLDRVG